MAGYIGSKAVNLSTTGADINGDANIDGDLSFGDDNKAIFGAGSDLQIYHSGAGSFISDVGNGALHIRGTNLILQNGDGTKRFIDGNDGGAVEIHHGDATNAIKLTTTSTGIDVTGTVTADGLTVDGTSQFNTGAAGIAEFFHSSGYGGIKATGSAAGSGATIYLSNDKNGTPFDIYTIFADGSDDSLQFWSGGNPSSGTKRFNAASNGDISFYEDTGTTPKFFWDASAESLAIGSPSADNVTIYSTDDVPRLEFEQGGTVYADIGHRGASAGARQNIFEITTKQSEPIAFRTANTERMRIDSSGNLLVGKTSSDATTTGFEAQGNGQTIIGRTNGAVLKLNRLSSDGDIASFRKDGTTILKITNISSTLRASIAGTNGSTGVGIYFANSQILPTLQDGSVSDNTADLGNISYRWDDVYATNGTIQTSDRNEKQDIDVLSDAEQRVAVACKGLLRKFRWKDAVAEKGDEARTHFGIIAQDLQAAFAAEGLDAGDYAMFISTTWWETQTEVPAVEAVAEVLDDDGNVVTEAVEAVDAYTRTDTYDTQEEAPEGATERTRLGVRYSELLAFIIGAL